MRQALSFSELSTSSHSSLDPYCNYVKVNISLNNFSLLSFHILYAPPICSSPTDTRTDSFTPSIPFSSKNLFILKNFNCHHPSGTRKVLPTPLGRKYLIGSSPLTSLPSMTLTYLLFYIAPLTFLLLPSLSPYLAPGRCFKTWVLITYQFY